MLLRRNLLFRVIAEVSFLYALAFPMIKSISNVDWLYYFFQSYAYIVSLSLYLIILILFPALFPTKKQISSYMHGVIIFSFYIVYIIMGETTLSPSILLMVIVCFWETILGIPFEKY